METRTGIGRCCCECCIGGTDDLGDMLVTLANNMVESGASGWVCTAGTWGGPHDPGCPLLAGPYLLTRVSEFVWEYESNDVFACDVNPDCQYTLVRVTIDCDAEDLGERGVYIFFQTMNWARGRMCITPSPEDECWEADGIILCKFVDEFYLRFFKNMTFPRDCHFEDEEIDFLDFGAGRTHLMGGCVGPGGPSSPGLDAALITMV